MARTNLRIEVVSYTGDGTDSRNLNILSGRPKLLIIKGGANNAVFRTRLHRGDNTGNLASGAADQTDRIQTFLNDGFQVGTNVSVNENGTVYHALAIYGTRGQKHFRVGQYVGTGGDDRNFTGGGLGFTPDLFATKSASTTDAAIFKTSSMSGDDAGAFALTANAANRIQSLISGGVQLGSSALTNTSAVYYNFFALKQLSGAIKFGTYTGDGVDGRRITGLGFGENAPDFVLVKITTSGARAWIRTSNMTGDTSLSMGAEAAASNMIQGLITDGFELGSSANVNGSGSTYHFWAFKAGSYSAPITRTAV